MSGKISLEWNTFCVLLVANKHFTADTDFSLLDTAYSIGRNCVHSEVIHPTVLQYTLNIKLKIHNYL